MVGTEDKKEYTRVRLQCNSGRCNMAGIRLVTTKLLSAKTPP